MANYVTTHSRSIPRADSSVERFTTRCIYVDSGENGGATALPGRDLQNGFTVTLNNPILLDISTRYVMCLIKAEFDTLALGGQFYDVNINTPLIEFQYVNNQQQQLLNKIYKVKYDAAFYQTSTPFEYQAINPINRFIQSTTKNITQVSFTIDIVDKNGIVSPLPPGLYSTRICFIIKQVPPNVTSVTVI